MSDVPEVGHVYAPAGAGWREWIEVVAVTATHWCERCLGDSVEDRFPLEVWPAWFKQYNAVDLTARLAPPAAPTGETVRIRVAVGVNQNGRHYGYGMEGETDAELLDQIRACDYDPKCFIEADVPA